MVFSFVVNDGRLLAALLSFGNEYHVVFSRYVKLFLPHFVFIHSDLWVLVEITTRSTQSKGFIAMNYPCNEPSNRNIQ